MKDLTSSVYTFEDLRRGDYLYIDKTKFIWELARQPKGIYFLSRPRRFGKSLTISTLKALFQGRRELFKGLAIDAKDYDWKIHPVIHLDLGSCGAQNAEELREYLLFLLKFAAQDLNIEPRGTVPSMAFMELIRKVSRTAPAVILIDEYDKPILNNAGSSTAGEILRELKSFYGVIKTTEPHQRFVFLTGVGKFTKVSVFSDLNNLNEITMDARYATMLGYTQTELEENFAEHIADAACKNNVSPDALLSQMRHWYNGYRFEETAETVYNPVSVAQFFMKGGRFRNYWFETGSPSILFAAAKNAGFDFRDALTRPVQDLAFSQFEVTKLQPLPLLVQTGYLTIKKTVADSFGVAYYLGFPNFEVESAFEMFLLDDYLPGVTSFDVVRRLRDALSSGDHEALIGELNSLLGAIPWQNHIKHESYYHTVAFLAMRLTGLSVTSEESVGGGNIDAGVVVGDKVYIFEFKLDRSADAAMAQIQKNNYAAQWRTSGKRVILFAVNFSSSERRVDGWLAREITSI